MEIGDTTLSFSEGTTKMIKWCPVGYQVTNYSNIYHTKYKGHQSLLMPDRVSFLYLSLNKSWTSLHRRSVLNRWSTGKTKTKMFRQIEIILLTKCSCIFKFRNAYQNLSALLRNRGYGSSKHRNGISAPVRETMKTIEVTRKSSENNSDFIFTCENIIIFPLWKYHLYSIRIYIDFTAYKKKKQKKKTQCKVDK